MNRVINIRKILFAAIAFGIVSGCSEKPLEERDQLQISASVSFAPRNEVSGVIDNSMIENLDFSFLRAEIGRRSIEYQPDVISASCIFPDGESEEATVIFSPKQYYKPDGSYSMMEGWYPAGTYNSESMEVSIPFDGNVDIIASQFLIGNYEDRAIDDLFIFNHQLTQLQLEVIAESELAAQKWGKVTSITMTGESDTYINVLPEDESEAEEGVYADFDGTSDHAVTLPSEEIEIPYEEAVPAGMLMVEPRTIGARSSSMTFLIETTGNGTTEVVIDAEEFNGEKFPAGTARKVTLRFLQGTIEIIVYADPVPWDIPETVEHNIGENQAYVRKGENYIVTRNMFGNAAGWNVRSEEWTAETDYSSEAMDSVPAVLEVYTEDSGNMSHSGAVSACSDLGEGWRLPCRMELQLIAAYKDQLDKPAKDGSVHAPEGTYWSATVDGSGNAFYVDMSDISSAPETVTAAHNVRCVRDIVME